MGIVRPVMEVFPFAWLFFLPFILITSFTVLNLFIGIIVDAMQSQHTADLEADRSASQAAAAAAEEERATILSEIRHLRAEIASLKDGGGR